MLVAKSWLQQGADTQTTPDGVGMMGTERRGQGVTPASDLPDARR